MSPTMNLGGMAVSGGLRLFDRIFDAIQTEELIIAGHRADIPPAPIGQLRITHGGLLQSIVASPPIAGEPTLKVGCPNPDLGTGN